MTVLGARPVENEQVLRQMVFVRAGLDPVARQLFYDRLLADYAEHPRTVLLSTRLIDEAAGLMEREACRSTHHRRHN